MPLLMATSAFGLDKKTNVRVLLYGFTYAVSIIPMIIT